MTRRAARARATALAALLCLAEERGAVALSSCNTDAATTTTKRRRRASSPSFAAADAAFAVRPRAVAKTSLPRFRLATRRNFRLFDREDGVDGSSKNSANAPTEPLPPWVESLLNWQIQPSLPNLMQIPPPTVEDMEKALEEAQQMLASEASLSGVDATTRSGEKTKEKKPKTYPDDFSPEEVRGGGTQQLPVPLASLINVEALLLASEGDVLNADVSDDAFNGDETIAKTSGQDEPPPPPPPLDVLPDLEELGDFDRFVRNLRSSMDPFLEEAARRQPSVEPSQAASDAASLAESVLRTTTSRIAAFLDETSSALSPAAVQDLVVRASNALAIEESAGGIRAAADEAVRTAERLARESGLDVSVAAERARETTRYTEELLRVANGVLVSGYVSGDGRGAAGVVRTTAAREPPPTAKAAATDALYSKPLFDDFPTARAVSTAGDTTAADAATAASRRRVVDKPAEMARLSGAIYENTVEEAHAAGHSIVARGTTGDVAWMVTDAIGYEEDFRDETDATDSDAGSELAPSQQRTPIMVRTITVRGFDASDEDVDRERLLMRITSASSVPLGGPQSSVRVHAGLLSVARKLYNELMEYVDLVGPNHRVVLNGHSIGGSLSVLMLMLMAEKRGADFVRERVLRAFTFGSPPIAMINNGGDGASGSMKLAVGSDGDALSCSVLEAFDLPPSIVHGYVQPWDPIVRLFSSIDPLYPLIEDIGEDGVTLYASGPNRALRPITRAIFESWDGWSRFRDNILEDISPNFRSVGIQHVLLPEPVRYLTDRLVGANLAVPPVDTVVRISSDELLPSLERTYPLDVFGISFVPAALRSFVHHFYPAYVEAFVDYAAGEEGALAKSRKKRVAAANANANGGEGNAAAKKKRSEKRDREEVDSAWERAIQSGGGGGGADSTDDPANGDTPRARSRRMDWAGVQAQWILGGNKVLGGDVEDDSRR